MSTIFTCPSCGGFLTKKDGGFCCENGHRHDIARQGYLNLLMPNKRHSKLPGDTPEMVSARRVFLDSGYYGLFRDKLAELSLKYTEKIKDPVFLDAGCGEGYYTALVAEKVKNSLVYGFDISKAAVKAAAGKYKGIDFAVASIFDIPVKSGAADCLLSVFAPIVEGEFMRALKSGGIMIIAVPGKKHLWEMKGILYKTPYENEVRDTAYDGFAFLERVPVFSQIEINNAAMLWNLFSMTPYFWKTDVEGGERLKKTEHIKIEIEFDFLVYRKN